MQRVNGKKATPPHPCGHAGDTQRACNCSQERIRSYLGKLSGPLLDRLDLIVEVPALSHAELLEQLRKTTDWLRVRQQIADCGMLQLERNGKLNSELGVRDLDTICPLPKSQRRLLASTMEKLGLSARTTHRVIKVARTIADFQGRSAISSSDLLEAVSYRRCQLLSNLTG